MDRDSHRPVYHFLPPQNWMNDPNGLIQWKGVYHLFYQHNPFAAAWGPMYWGHATSSDLVHWIHQPIALSPTPGGPDEHGVWSGVAVDHDGTPTIFYSGNRNWQQRCCLAISQDDLQSLQKYPGNPVIPEPPPGYDFLNYRDHCVWREGGTWYQLMGAGIKDVGGAAFLYRSPDLIHWELVGPILTGQQVKPGALSTDTTWECPDFFSLDDQHLLVVSVYTDVPQFTGYFLGSYRDFHFTPRLFDKLDLGDAEFYAPQTFVDANSTRIQFGWISEARPVEQQLAAGWAGVLSLPRRLDLLPDGILGIQPHPAVERLRQESYHCSAIVVKPQETRWLDVRGSALEIHSHFAPGGAFSAQRVGLKIFCSPDGSEETLLCFDKKSCQLEVIRQRSSRNPGVALTTKGGLLNLPEDEGLDLRIFIDQSVIEIFANGCRALTCRVYPSEESTGIALFAQGGEAVLEALDAWRIEAIWE